MTTARQIVSPSRRGTRAHRGTRLRLQDWPVDQTVGQLVVTDQHTIPTRAELIDIVAAARRDGYRALRTGALFPRAADIVLELGFEVIDTLVLLQFDLDDAAVPRPPTRPLRRWQHAAAACVDRRAFGELWGNDARSLAAIRAATPTHRARRLGGRARVHGFAISGAGGRVGYLQRLAVDPEHQRRGLGRALAQDALWWMGRRRLTTAMVNTGVGNEAALALYDGLGFHPTPDRLTIAELELHVSPP